MGLPVSSGSPSQRVKGLLTVDGRVGEPISNPSDSKQDNSLILLEHQCKDCKEKGVKGFLGITFKMAPWSTVVKVFTCFAGGLLLLSFDLLVGFWIWEGLVAWGIALFLLIIAPWNATAKIWAYFGGSVLIGGSIFLADPGLFAHSYRGFEWAILLGVWMIMPLAYIFAPLGCIADTKRVLVKRAIGPIIIPYEQILSVEVKKK